VMTVLFRTAVKMDVLTVNALTLSATATTGGLVPSAPQLCAQMNAATMAAVSTVLAFARRDGKVLTVAFEAARPVGAEAMASAWIMLAHAKMAGRESNARPKLARRSAVAAVHVLMASACASLASVALIAPFSSARMTAVATATARLASRPRSHTASAMLVSVAPTVAKKCAHQSAVATARARWTAHASAQKDSLVLPALLSLAQPALMARPVPPTASASPASVSATSATRVPTAGIANAPMAAAEMATASTTHASVTQVSPVVIAAI